MKYSLESTLINGDMSYRSRTGSRLDVPEYHFYLRDHLGNNRMDINAANQRFNQAMHYYPFGLPFYTDSRVTSDSRSGSQRWLFGNKELDRTSGLDLYDFEARAYDPTIIRFRRPDDLAFKYQSTSPYTYCLNNPLNTIDPDGKDAIYITFPNYRANGIPYTGHAGILLIDNRTGLTKYYEYGRYDKAQMGIVRSFKIPNVSIDKDGMPTKGSLTQVLRFISEKAGHGGDIEGAYIKSDSFSEMNNYAKSLEKQNEDSQKREYSLLKNNCATFAKDVLLQDKEVERPFIIINTPINIVEEFQEEGYPRIFFDSKIKSAVIER